MAEYTVSGDSERYYVTDGAGVVVATAYTAAEAQAIADELDNADQDAGEKRASGIGRSDPLACLHLRVQRRETCINVFRDRCLDCRTWL